jgi:hypothetical protein
MTMEIDLRGPQGNAHALMGVASSAARLSGYGAEFTSRIIQRMCAGTYEDLLDVLDDEFPGAFRFVGDPRPNPKTLAPEIYALSCGGRHTVRVSDHLS